MIKPINEMIFKWLRHRKRLRDIHLKAENLYRVLKENDPETRAGILAMAAVYRHSVIDQSAQLSKALNYSHKMSKERLGLIFELLQAIQTKMEQEKSALDVKLEALQIREEANVTHWQKSQLGMDLWMVTIGAAYASQEKNRLTAIWKLLDVTDETLDQAIRDLHELEATVNELSPAQKEMFGGITDAQWKAACAYRPGFMPKNVDDESVT